MRHLVKRSDDDKEFRGSIQLDLCLARCLSMLIRALVRAGVVRLLHSWENGWKREGKSEKPRRCTWNVQPWIMCLTRSYPTHCVLDSAGCTGYQEINSDNFTYTNSHNQVESSHVSNIRWSEDIHTHLFKDWRGVKTAIWCCLSPQRSEICRVCQSGVHTVPVGCLHVTGSQRNPWSNYHETIGCAHTTCSTMHVACIGMIHVTGHPTIQRKSKDISCKSGSCIAHSYLR